MAAENTLQYVPCRRNHTYVFGIHSAQNEKGTPYQKVPFGNGIYNRCGIHIRLHIQFSAAYERLELQQHAA